MAFIYGYYTIKKCIKYNINALLWKYDMFLSNIYMFLPWDQLVDRPRAMSL